MLDEVNSILETAREKISEFEDVAIEIILNDTQEKDWTRMSRQFVIWDNFRWYKVLVIRVPKGEERLEGTGKKYLQNSGWKMSKFDRIINPLILKFNTFPAQET